MDYQNMINPSDSASSDTGKLSGEVTSALGKGFVSLDKHSANILTNFEKMYKLVEKMYDKKFGLLSQEMDKDGNPKSTNRVADGLGTFGKATTGQKIGLGTAAAVVGGGALMYNMMPNTASAVTQRMGLNALMTGPGGLTPNQTLKKLNSAIGLGVTGVGSPVQAANALLYQGGLIGTSAYNSKSIMQQIGGLSAMTGGTNQQMAGAVGGINAMNFLRSGTQTRDSKGNLLPINQIINNLYRSMYGGQKITAEQAAMVYSPYSPSHRTVMQAAGGDPNLFAVLAEGLRTRAMAGENITAKQMQDPNKILDIRGIPKNDPIRANFKNNAAQNKLLENTQEGLVSGYTTAVNANADLTNGFADIAKELGPVTQGLANLKGILQTFPNAGSVGGTLSGIASTAASYGLAAKFMGGGGLKMPGTGAPVVNGAPMLLGPNGKPLAPSTPGVNSAIKGAAIKNFLKSTTGKLGIGTLAAAGATYGLDKAFGNKVKATTRSRGLAMAGVGSMALTGAAIGSMFAPGIGTGIGAVLGTGLGLMQNMGGLFGQGGGDACGHGNMPHKCNSGIGGDNTSSNTSGQSSGTKLQMPVPPGTKVTSPFGPRAGAAARNPGISKNHTGIDYGVPVGSKVVAAGDGVVTETGLHRQYGQYIIIKHGKKSTLYAHLSKLLIKRGQNVVAGQVIALSGGKKGAFGAGSSTGPHLHFEVRDNGGVGAQGRVNPKGLFGKAFNFIKNLATTAINFAKQTSNKYLGTNLSFRDSSKASMGINLNSKENLSALSSASVGTLISNALTSGKPLDTATIKANIADSSDSSVDYTAYDTSDSKSKKKVLGTVNNKEDLASGDRVGMVGGSRAGLIKMLYDGGFRGKGLSTAFSVALAESGGRAKAKYFEGRDLSYGLFQINMKDDDPRSPNMGRNRRKQFGIAKNEALYDPMTNIRAAYEISNKGSWWKQWSTFNDGKFSKYLDDAARAATQAKIPTYHSGSYNVPKSGIGGGESEHLAMVQEGEMILPAKLAEKVRNGTGYNGTNTNIKVDMHVNIARSSVQEAELMFKQFKLKLEKELKNGTIGTY